MEHPAVTALRQFADPANWSDIPGSLRWVGKRHAIIYAEEVLASLSVICPLCRSVPPFGGRCPHEHCPHGLQEHLKIMVGGMDGSGKVRGT